MTQAFPRSVRALVALGLCAAAWPRPRAAPAGGVAGGFATRHRLSGQRAFAAPLQRAGALRSLRVADARGRRVLVDAAVRGGRPQAHRKPVAFTWSRGEAPVECNAWRVPRGSGSARRRAGWRSMSVRLMALMLDCGLRMERVAAAPATGRMGHRMSGTLEAPWGARYAVESPHGDAGSRWPAGTPTAYRSASGTIPSPWSMSSTPAACTWPMAWMPASASTWRPPRPRCCCWIPNSANSHAG